MERLHKRIASSGYCSRRTAEKFIEAGEVKVNGEVVTTQGTLVSEKDKIEVQGQRLKFGIAKVTLAFNKPAGVVTTRDDPDGAKTVMDILPGKFQHLNPVGRLDRESEGLLLFSNDGDLILKLTHPRYEHEKTYEVGVWGEVGEGTLERLAKGVKLSGTQLNPMQAEVIRVQGKQTWLRMVLSEGRRRQIRRVMEQFGHSVFSVKRVAIGQLKLGDLKSGGYRLLDTKEIELAFAKA